VKALKDLYRKGYNRRSMPQPPALKASLKRGAFIAAANWPLIAVQFVAGGTLKLLLAVPVVGGILLVVLLLGADVEEVLAGDVRQIIGAVVGALRANPVALAAFGASFLLVLLGGCRVFGRRYEKLGACLLIAYTVTGGIYLGFISGGYALAGTLGVLFGWSVAAALSLIPLVVWITVMNFLYLLTQMAIAVEDIGVRDAARRVGQFIRAGAREVAGIFGVVLLLALLAAVASILATAGLGLIAFIPLVGLAMVPLQVAAWLLRGFVFEYLALTALGAYLTQYRYYLNTLAAMGGQPAAADLTGQRLA
jgi:hypothetical protein